MRIVATLFYGLLELVFLYELFVYGIRRYELGNSGEAPARYGFVNAVGWFLVEWATRSLFLVAAPFGFLWPFASGPTGPRRPVIMIHGFGTTRASFAILAWRLRRDGYGPIVAASYSSLGGTLADAIRSFRAAIEEACAGNGAEGVDVVAHSLGGLVVRRALRDDPALAPRVRKLVTLGTPHGGSKIAALAINDLGRELHPDSDLIHFLGEGDAVPANVEATSIFSTFDALVLPPRNGFLRGAMNVEVSGIGHNALLVSPKVYTLVREALSPRT